MRKVITYINEREDEFARHYNIAHLLENRLSESFAEVGINIEIRHINTLKSGLIIHLYNIVEAACTRILETVGSGIVSDRPRFWTDDVLHEWVRGEFWSAEEKIGDGALKHLRNISRTLVDGYEMSQFRIKGTPGSWDKDAIQKVAKQMGCNLDIPQDILRSVSEKVYRNDTNALKYLANRRNDIAHGNTTFEDGVYDLTLAQLKELADRVIPYLKAVADSFEDYLKNKAYLRELETRIMTAHSSITAVDLFCGVGGLTRGLSNAGINVKLGVDLDPACEFPLEENNDTRFLQGDVSKLKASTLKKELKGSKISLLAGCAPCQPFSSYSNSTGKQERHKDWGLLKSFEKLVLKVQPTLVTMENVPPLERKGIFAGFTKTLEKDGYHVSYRVVHGKEIGLPQRRRRLVLVASKLGPIELPEWNEPVQTVRDAIADLQPIQAGVSNSKDRLHFSAGLSDLNLERIKHSKPGGTWRDWPEHLVAKCHTKKSGRSFPSVYGRMRWDQPAPTMTTQCFGFGNGRFGHPEQDRAISLREAAIIQSFPEDYAFLRDDDPISISALGRLIGNAVPVKLGEYIGDVLVKHVNKYC